MFQETGIKDLPLLLLAFRAVSQKPVEFFVKNAEKLSNPNEKFGVEDEEYNSTDYSTLFNLCTHYHRRDTNDIYSKTIFAAFLLRCLQEVGYFKTVTQEPAGMSHIDKFVHFKSRNLNARATLTKNKIISGTTLTQAEATIGRLIKHFLDCIQFNTHTVESIFENRVVAWDAETRLWKNLNR